MSNLSVATMATAEGEEVNGKAEMVSATAAVSEGNVKRKKRRKQEVPNAKENGKVEQEAASVSVPVLADGTMKHKKRKKQEVADAMENQMVEPEVASIAAAAVLGMPNSKEEANEKERLMTEHEASNTSVCALDERLKCKKKKKKGKERGMVEQGTTMSAVSEMEGTAKCKEEKVKERGMVEHEATIPTVSKCMKKKKKANERGIVEKGTTSSAVSAMERTSKCKEEKVKEMGMVEQEATAATVSSLERTPKCNKNDKEKATQMAEKKATTTTVLALEGSVKCKKKKKANETVMDEPEPSTAISVLEGTKKYKIKEEKGNETGLAKQEIAPVAVSECKKKKAKERGVIEQGTTSAAVSAMEGTSKCKEEKVKEREMVEQEATAATVSALEGTWKCNKKDKEKERRMAEKEATTTTASALEGTEKCKKKKKAKETVMDEPEPSTAISVLEGTKKYKIKGEKGNETGLAMQEIAPASLSEMKGTAKCKEKVKEGGMVKHEATTPTVSECKTKKAKERGVVVQGTTSSSVSAMEETSKCKEGKVKEMGMAERGMVEQEATAATVSALEGTPKHDKKDKEKESRMAEKEDITATVLVSEGTTKRTRKKLKKKNKMQEQQESTQAISCLAAGDKIVANKHENDGTNGERAFRDADISTEIINAEDPNCSKAKDANDKMKFEGQEGNGNCNEAFSLLQEGSENRKGQERTRKRDASSRGSDVSYVDGGRVAKSCQHSSMDHDGSYISASCLGLAHKEEVKNIYSPRGSLIRFQRKKLLILDLNGLLADINMDMQNAHMAHAKVKGKLVFKRPYYDEFLRFCFQNFELGIWSSRKMENVNSVVNILMRDLKRYLLFCWDMSKCTFTGRKVIGNMHKPLVLKELKKLWNKEDPTLPWEQGEFSPSNTLLVDDSPYKALRNPPHTAIFPQPYSYLNQRNDCSLGPGGDLRMYLERLAAADDVQVFVRDNPFGQPSITESDPMWNFYAKIANKVELGL